MFFYSEPDPIVEPAFDFEEYYTYAGGWPGVLESINYDWNPAEGEESLAMPDFIEDFNTTTGGWL